MNDSQLLLHLAALMGWEEGKDYICGRELLVRRGQGVLVAWRPLRSMDDAMQLVEHLRTRTTRPRYWCEMRTPFQDGDQYLVGFTAWAFTGWNGRPDFMALADSLPRAIALAALETREEG